MAGVDPEEDTVPHPEIPRLITNTTANNTAAINFRIMNLDGQSLIIGYFNRGIFNLPKY
jgi:hypothetical protein